MSAKFVWVLLLLSSIGASAEDLTGRWKTVMVDPPPGSGLRPKTGYEPIFEFTVKDGVLTGKALLKRYPGNATILEGKSDGIRFSFRVVHEEPHVTNILTGEATHRSFVYTGTIGDGVITLLAVPTSQDGLKSLANSKPGGGNYVYTLKGTRLE